MTFRPVEIAHPRWVAWLFPFGVIFLAGLSAIVIWLAWSGLVHPGWSLFRRAEALIMLGCGVWLVHILLQSLRGWYAYWTHYELSDSGIRVRHPDGTVDFVSWDEITLAVCTGWPAMIRLHCLRTRRPLTLFDPSAGPTDSFQFKRAQVMVRSKLRSRWKKRIA